MRQYFSAVFGVWSSPRNDDELTPLRILFRPVAIPVNSILVLTREIAMSDQQFSFNFPYIYFTKSTLIQSNLLTWYCQNDMYI